MYRRPKFLEVLIEIREEMAREADYDTDLFAEMVRSGHRPADRPPHALGEGEQGDNDEKVQGPRRSRTR